MKIRIDERDKMPIHPKANLTNERLFRNLHLDKNPNKMVLGMVEIKQKQKKEKKHGFNRRPK